MTQGTAILEFLENYSKDVLQNMENISDICERRGYKNTAYNSMLDVLMAYNKNQSDILQVLIEMETNIIKKV